MEESPVESRPPRISDDWLAVSCAALILTVSFAGVWLATERGGGAEDSPTVVHNPLKSWLSKPSKWTESPIDSFVTTGESGNMTFDPAVGTAGAFALLALLLSLGVGYRDGASTGLKFFKGFAVIFLLATLAYVMAAQSVVKAYNLEYAVWALMVGLLISNTVGTPAFMKTALRTEFLIKTGLVLLGAEVLMSRLLALGLPGIFVAWVVTPIVLISTYIFGQKVLKMESRSLNMVISADMSVCGVSAAIAAAAACKAKKEELTLAIGMSLSFTVLMMIALPAVIKAVGMDEVLGGAWLGGTIDATGAVAAAGAALGDRALEVAATVKMIQNILIGVSAFGIATYWVTYVEADPNAAKPDVMEIWRRFPKFVIGFVIASVLFSILHGTLADGPALVDGMIKGSTKTLRGWLFCLAFVSIGLETSFRELLPYFKVHPGSLWVIVK